MFRFTQASTARAALLAAAVALFASHAAMSAQPKEISYWAAAPTAQNIQTASRAGDASDRGVSAQYASQAGDRKDGAAAQYASRADDSHRDLA